MNDFDGLTTMVEFLGTATPRYSDWGRRSRLYCVALCREALRIGPDRPWPWMDRALFEVETRAESGQFTSPYISDALLPLPFDAGPGLAPAVAWTLCVGHDLMRAPYMVVANMRGLLTPRFMADTLRGTFPCPLRRIPWYTPKDWAAFRVAEAVAREAYGARAPDGSLEDDRLAVLSDALQDAGVDDQRLIAMLAAPLESGRRYPGFWPLDLFRGR